MTIDVFANRLNDLMQTEKVSKRALSMKINVARHTIMNWCKGKYYPRYDTLIKLADFFQISLDYLLGIEKECLKEFVSDFPLERIPEIYKLRIKEGLKEKKMSEYKFAKLLNIEQGMVSKWKKQAGLPETETIIKISQILDCSIDYLLGRS